MYVQAYVCFAQQLTVYTVTIDGAMIDCKLYKTFQSLTVNRTETVTSICREVSVAMSSTVLGQSARNFAARSSWSCSNW